MMMHGRTEVKLHIFLTFALDGGECSDSCPLKRRLGGTQSQYGHGKKKVSLNRSQHG